MQVPAFLSFWNLEHVLSVLLRLDGLDPIPNYHTTHVEDRKLFPGDLLESGVSGSPL